jgi:glucose-1-phosphate thymidylyltransferase
MCGGFAKRMAPIANGTPKALLPVAGKPVIQYIIDRLGPIGEVEKILISTNKRFEGQFRDFLSGCKPCKGMELVVEPALSEGEKLGSIGALRFLIERGGIDDDLMVINGDNLFKFGLRGFVDFYKARGGTVVGVYDVRKIDEAKKLGIVEIDKSKRIVGFEEKPEKPKSTLASTGIYIYPKNILKLILEYLKQGNSPDAPGYFLAWLYRRQPVYGFVFREQWFDIGSPETYREAEMGFGSR